jgi:hypothetical protein
MHVVETTIQIYFRPLFYEKVKHLWRWVVSNGCPGICLSW